jgi:lysophospholipase L1-like esterase
VVSPFVKSKTRQGIIAAASCALIFIGAELLLRLAGHIALGSAIFELSANSQQVRILTLGESTTAKFFATNEPWPEKLEEKLNQAGVEAKIFNEAVPGTTTASILANLNEQIEKYQPHIVISMMGINDVSSILYDGSSTSKFQLFLSNSRLIKLARLTTDRVRALLLNRMDYTILFPRDKQPLADLGYALAVKGATPEETERAIRSSSPTLSDLKIALLLTEVAVRLGGYEDFGQPHRNMREAIQYNRRSFELFPFNRTVAYWYMHAGDWFMHANHWKTQESA